MKLLRIITIIGARPQFIKAAAVSRVLRNACAGRAQEILVHTGKLRTRTCPASSLKSWKSLSLRTT